jgi:hypothetical protein
MSANEMADRTATTKSGIGATGGDSSRRSRRRSMIRRAAMSAACLAGTAGIMLAMPAVASATVSQSSSPWAELGSLAYTGDQANQVTAVYSIQNLAEPGDTMLEDNDVDSGNGALTNVWQAGPAAYQDPDAISSDLQILAANHLWEFVPAAGNTGGQITTGYGELINRQSGLCLDVNGSDPDEYGDGAIVDQWTCGGGPNQEWTSSDFSGGSGYTLEPQSDTGIGISGDLGVGNSTCDPRGNGDQVYVRTTGQAGNTCDEWNIQQASYSFATSPIDARAGELDADPGTNGNTDNRTYGCVSGYDLREQAEADSAAGYYDIYWDYDNLSDEDQYGDQVTVETIGIDQGGDLQTTAQQDPNQLKGGTLWYYHPDLPYWLNGQIMLYCDPGTTSA